MNIVIDRFEANYAVCEMEDGTMVDVPKQLIPTEAKEGDVLHISVRISPLKTKKRKEEIERLFGELLE